MYNFGKSINDNCYNDDFALKKGCKFFRRSETNIKIIK